MADHPHPDQPWTSQDLEDAVNRAVRAALKRHKERGESVVMWIDGKIVTLKPEEIDVCQSSTAMYSATIFRSSA